MHNRGFTLIELLVVIAIIGVLSSVVLASLNTARERANDARRQSDLRQVQNALELYYSTNGTYPICTSFSAWNATMWSQGSAPTNCLYLALVPTYISTLPSDPNGNTEGGSGNYLGDNYPTDRAYVYTATQHAYILGVNLSRGGTANVWGNFQIKN